MPHGSTHPPPPPNTTQTIPTLQVTSVTSTSLCLMVSCATAVYSAAFLGCGAFYILFMLASGFVLQVRLRLVWLVRVCTCVSLQTLVQKQILKKRTPNNHLLLNHPPLPYRIYV